MSGADFTKRIQLLPGGRLSRRGRLVVPKDTGGIAKEGRQSEWDPEMEDSEWTDFKGQANFALEPCEHNWEEKTKESAQRR